MDFVAAIGRPLMKGYRMNIVELLNQTSEEMSYVRDLLYCASASIGRAIGFVDCGTERHYLEEGMELVNRAHSAVDELVVALE
jgi:hypothetical protein